MVFSRSTLRIQLNKFLPLGIYLFKFNSRNTRTSCEICSKLTIKIPKRRQRRSDFVHKKIKYFSCDNQNSSNLVPKISQKAYQLMWLLIVQMVGSKLSVRLQHLIIKVLLHMFPKFSLFY